MTDKTPTQVVLVPSEQISPDDEIDLIAIWRVFWRWKWFIGGLTLLGTLIAVYWTLYQMPVRYRSTAVLQPTLSASGQSDLRASLGQFIPLPASSGGDKTQLIINFLSSRTLKLWMIKKLDLLPRLYPDLWDDENKAWLATEPSGIPSTIKAIQSNALGKFYSVKNDTKTGLITISYLDGEPEFAAKAVTEIYGELKRYLDQDYISDAKRRRIFIEVQLERSRKEVVYWERRVPGAKHTASEILREQGATLAAYTELRKQYELAKIEEARELIAFKVLDSPLVPVKKSEPKRAQICGLTLIVTFFLAVFLAFFFEFIGNARKREKEREKALPDDEIARDE